MTPRAPHVRRVNMLSEYHSPDHDGEPRTQGFFRALSEADNFIAERDRAAELACRCDELTQLVADIKAVHRQERQYRFPGTEFWGADMCASCEVPWPCPTMKLIEGAA